MTHAAGSSYSELLKAMWSLVEDSPKLQLLSKVIHVELCVDDLSVSIEELISKYKISDNHIHDACDSGYIRLLCDDDSAVAFAHPSVIIDLATYFGKERLLDQNNLSNAEKICLIYAYNSGSDEINECLVAQSLCYHGLTVPGIGKLTFRLDRDSLEHCYTGAVRKIVDGGHTPTATLSSELLNSSNELGTYSSGISSLTVNPAKLRKEYPDEFGSDLIALFTVDAQSLQYADKIIVVRVQIKLGLSTTRVDSVDRTPIQHMRAYEAMIAEYIGKSDNDIIFVCVLWTSRPTADVDDESEHIVVISGEKLTSAWVPKVARYVNDAKLKAYGYRG